MPSFSKAQHNLCDSADLFCSGQGTSFTGSVNGGSAEPGAYYGCLATQPNPYWLYMKILNSGTIFITMEPIPNWMDIDFACWGPFTSPTEPCVAGLTASKMIACDYYPLSRTVDTIPNGITGEYYILLITNYSNLVDTINLSQTGGTGTLDCITTSQETAGLGNSSVSLRNFPNPCNNKTTFVFTVHQNTKAKLDIYDITGRYVQTLFDGEAIKDKDYTINYDCKDTPPGISIYKLTTNENTVTGKMMHINNFSVPN